MKLLLDTHTFLWFAKGSAELSPRTRSLIAGDDNEVFLSTASLWEMAIKINLGKLTIAEPFDVFMSQQLAGDAITLLQVSVKHAVALATL
jgi:PIN domain nuclease of toxin-antitoxin system